MRSFRLPFAGMVLFCVSGHGLALEAGITGGLSAEWNDNVFLSENDRRSDWLETLSVTANLDGEEAEYQYGSEYTISYERYERDSFDPTTYYSGTAFLNLSLIPRRFEWYSSVLSETTLRESTGNNTPDNRDQRNVFSTSPTLTLIAWQRDTVTVSAQAAQVTYRESEESDSDRVGGNLRWVHAVSTLLDFNVEASQQKVTFDEATDYDSENYRLGFTRQINGGSIDASAGQTSIKPEIGEEFDGAQYLVSINWSNDQHSLLFDVFHDLTDSSIGLSGEFDSSGFITPSEVDTDGVELLTRTRYSFSHGYALTGRFDLDTNLYFDEEETEDNSRNTVRQGAGLALTREMTPELRARAELNFERVNNDEDNIEETDYIRRYRLSLERNFYESLIASVWLRREEMNAEVDNGNYELHAVGASIEVGF